MDRAPLDNDSAASAGRPLSRRPLRLPLGRRECRIIFREMVRAELEARVLRLSSRRRLLKYANRLGISRFDAHLMIVEVQHERERPPSTADDRGRVHDFVKPRDATPVWCEPGYLRNLLLISAGVLILDAWLVNWLF